jgi:hypothetical protein
MSSRYEQLRSWLQFSLYLPGTRYSPNAGIRYPDRNVARYALELDVEFKPKILPWVFVFGKLYLPLGDWGPDAGDTYAAKLIGGRIKFGAGVVLSRRVGLDFRLAHAEWLEAWGYKRDRLVWSALQLRWTACPLDRMALEPFKVDRLGLWIEASFYPSHNEFDPNPGLFPITTRTVARYSLELAFEFWPKELTDWFVFGRFFLALGDSHPQRDYNYSAKANAVRVRFGVGYVLSRKHALEARLCLGNWFDVGGLSATQDRGFIALQLRKTFGF